MIDNLVPPTRTLVPELLPRLRPAWVESNVQSTYVVPGDWPGDQTKWFATDAPPFPRREANNVEYLIDGEATYEAMVEAMLTATGPDHFILIIGWTLHVNFMLSDDGSRCPRATDTPLNILRARVKDGVLLRVLLFPNPTDWSAVTRAKEEVDRLSAVSPGSSAAPPALCILDRNIRPFGSHHQKIVLVCGAEGLVGFLGGVDFNPDRVQNVPAVGGWVDVHGPLNDVHVRVTGEAAQDLLQLAVDRWNYASPYVPGFHPIDDLLKGWEFLVHGLPYGPGTGELDDLTPLLARAKGAARATKPHHIVKLGQTVGNPELANATGQGNGVWPIVRHAIEKAQRFIYMEEQYLWSCPAAKLLGEAAAKVQHITILLPPDDPIGSRERFDALRHMKDAAGSNAHKIRIYVLAEAESQYVHSKVFIIDDELAIIGSANCNDRGYVYDSEVNAAIADRPWTSSTGTREGNWWVAELTFARKLRIQLWEKYLRRHAEELVDGVAAEVHWRVPTGQGRIANYLVRGRLWHEVDYERPAEWPPLLVWPILPIVPSGLPAQLDWFVDPSGIERY